MLVGFFEFIRKQGVIGLTIGFILGGALSKFTSAVVNDLINPFVALLINTSNLRDKAWVVGPSRFLWGDLLAVTIDFVIMAAMVYYGFRLLHVDHLDLPKEDKP